MRRRGGRKREREREREREKRSRGKRRKEKQGEVNKLEREQKKSLYLEDGTIIHDIFATQSKGHVACLPVVGGHQSHLCLVADLREREREREHMKEAVGGGNKMQQTL